MDDAPPQSDRRCRPGPADRGISPRVLIGLAGNVLVFAPLGAALALALGGQPAGRRLLLATLVGAGLSLGIELVQITIPSRVTAVDDLLLNTTGTAIGALVCLGMQRNIRNQVFRKKPGFSPNKKSNKGDSND